MSKVNTGVALPLWVVTLGALLVFLSMAALVVGVIQGPGTGDASETPPLYDEQLVVSLYEKANPAVVRVETVINTPDRFGFLFPHGGQGSGFLVDTEGHILTNYHVVHDASTVQVVLPNGETLDAKVAGRSPADDVALLKVDAEDVAGIEPLPLADSSAIKAGQMVIAVGSPFGLDNSVTVGVISGVERSRPGILSRPITGMIQTDASLNPGNSGGPLLNSQGEVIGINTSIEASTAASIIDPKGIGFAVPINTAKDLMTRFPDNEIVKRPWLGISGAALSPTLAEILGIDTTEGVYIMTVSPGSPAEEAGLIAGVTDSTQGHGAGGDIIKAIDGVEVTAIHQMVDYFNSLDPGDSVTLTVERDGETVEVAVTLGEWPDGA